MRIDEGSTAIRKFLVLLQEFVVLTNQSVVIIHGFIELGLADESTANSAGVLVKASCIAIDNLVAVSQACRSLPVVARK